MRTCSKCGEAKPLDGFYKERAGGKVRRECITCTRARQRASRRANPKRCKHPDGCPKPAQPNRSGWCAMHAGRIEREGKPGELEPRRHGAPVVGLPPPVQGNAFRGNGRILCAACDKPTREHSIMERCG